MNGIIIYGSCYGTAKLYSEALSEKTGIKAVSYDRIPGLDRYETIIYVGGLYAGGVRGMAKTVKKIPADTCRRFIVVTVGLADPEDEKNVRNIRASAGKQIPDGLRARTEFYHLRGRIDYSKLNLVHRTMMKLLYEQVKKQPVEQQDAETRAMIETYGKKADFIDLDRLDPIAEMLGERAEKPEPRLEIRMMMDTEYPVLKDFLYEAIFVPEGEKAPERSILDQPELQVYISGFGRDESDCAVAALADGKIIGAGMPVGAYGGRKEIMEMVAPSGPVYQAGTLSGNPIAMAAGLAQLKILWEDQDIYKRLFQKGEILFEGIRKIFTEKGIGYQVNAVSSLGSIFFTETPVTDYQSAKTSDTKAFSKYFEYMLEHGVHLAPSQFEAIFLSDAHTEEDIRQFLELINRYF